MAKKKLEEGLIESYPVEKLRFRLDSETRLFNGKVLEINLDKQILYLIVKEIPSKEDAVTYIEEINNVLGVYGYFIAAINIVTENNWLKTVEEFSKSNFKFGSLYFQIEAKYDSEISEMPYIIYHVTSKKVIDKILKQGITPRVGLKKTYHPERVYVFFEISKAKGLMTAMKALSHKNETVLLEIKTPQNIQFYTDPQYKNGAYCLEPIPANNLKVIEYQPS